MGRKGSEVSMDIKNQIIFLYQNGHSLLQISTKVGRSHSTIQYIIKKYKTERNLENKPRNRNRNILNQRDINFLLREIKRDPKTSCPKLVKLLFERTGKRVCSETIRKTILKQGYKCRIARKKPFICKVNIRKRIVFAKKHLNKTENFWDRVIFTDECKFNISCWDGRVKIWRQVNTSLDTHNLIPTLKHGGGSLMIWGSFSSCGTGKLCFIDGIMNSKKYIEILKANLHSTADKLGISNNYILYQDNDPKHTALDTRLWLLYNCRKLMNPPPQSPDINPIENLWAFIKYRLKYHEIKSTQNLRDAIIYEWENIPTSLTKKLIKSMPQRLKSVIKRKGFPTKY